MAADEKLGSLLVEIGIQADDFKGQMAEISRRMGMAKAEFMAAGGSVKGFQDTAEGAAAKARMLTEQVELQRARVGLLSEEYTKMARDLGANSKEAQEMKIKLDGMRAELNRLQDELKQSTDKWASFSTSMQKAADKVGEFGDNAEELGGTLTTGLTVPITAAAAALGVLLNGAMDMADELTRASDVTGFTAERLQEFGYICSQVGGDVDTMTGAQSKLIKSMDAANKGTKDQAAAFATLGIRVVDGTGALRDSNTVFDEAIDRLGGVSNETERDALAMSIFGKSARELNPLIKAGSDELARMTKEARDNGAILSNESVKALDDFGDQIAAVQLTLKTMGAELAVEVLPTVQMLFEDFKADGIPAIKEVAKAVAGLLKGFADMSPEMQKVTLGLIALTAGIGPAISGIGGLANGVSSAIGLFGQLSGAISKAGGMMAILSGPAGIITITTVAAAGLGVALYSLGTWTGEATKEAKALADETARSASAFDKQTANIEAQGVVVDRLVGELTALAQKERLSNEEKTKMASLVAQINKLMPSLNLLIDDQTGKLNLQASAIAAVVEERKKQIALNLYDERLTELYTEQIIATENLEEAKRNLTKATDDYNQAVEAQGDYGAVTMTWQLQDARAAVKTYTDELEINKAAIAKAEEAYNKAAAAIGSMADTTGDATKQAAESMGMTVAEYEAYLAKLKELEDKRKKDVEDYHRALEQEAGRNMAAMGSIDQNMIDQSKITARKVEKNLWDQVHMFRTWRANIKAVADRVPDDVADGLKALGPKFAPLIAELSNMSDTELAKFVDAWRAKGAAAAGAAADELSGMPGAAGQVGQAAATQLADGMNEQGTIVQQAASALNRTAKSQFDPLPAALNALGKNAGQGLAAGLTATTPLVKAAGEALATVAKNAIKDALKISSPSKVTGWQGQMAGLGFAQGMEGMAGRVLMAASRLSAAASMTGAASYGVPSFSGGGTVNNNYYNATMPMTHNDNSAGWMSPALKEQFFREYQAFAAREGRRTGR